MKADTRNESLAYLSKNFLTVEQLAEQAEIGNEKLQKLIGALCVPGHSYEVANTTTIRSTFGDYAFAGEAIKYFHPSLVKWVKEASHLSEEYVLAEVSIKMREAFQKQFETALGNKDAPWPGGVDYAWSYMVDGTWGLCLNEISADTILAKEFARKTIKETKVTENNISILKQAIENYESVASEFAPHERPESSRCREISQIQKKLGMAGKGKLESFSSNP